MHYLWYACCCRARRRWGSLDTTYLLRKQVSSADVSRFSNSRQRTPRMERISAAAGMAPHATEGQDPNCKKCKCAFHSYVFGSSANVRV